MKNELILCKCGCGLKFEKYDKYGRERQFINGHNNKKYNDPTQYKREWNYRNRKSRYLYKKNYIANLKLKLIKQLGGKCEHCNIEADINNIVIFDFHHIEKKEFAITQATLNKKSFKIIENESKKCIILCSNCHRLHHHNN